MVKELVVKSNICATLQKLATLFKTTMRNKKNSTSCIKILSIKMTRILYKVWYKKKHKFEAENTGDQDGKALNKSIKNVVYGRITKNVRNRVDLRLVNNKREYLKWTSKPCHVSTSNIWQRLVAIHTIKATVRLKQPAYVGMFMLELSKVPPYEFNYD